MFSVDSQNLTVQSINLGSNLSILMLQLFMLT